MDVTHELERRSWAAAPSELVSRAAVSLRPGFVADASCFDSPLSAVRAIGLVIVFSVVLVTHGFRAKRMGQNGTSKT
jgi:hypothetical protein